MKGGIITEDTGSEIIAGRIGIETVTGTMIGNNTGIMTGIVTQGGIAIGKGIARKIRTEIEIEIIAGIVRIDGAGISP
jgi:hypothetical protein